MARANIRHARTAINGDDREAAVDYNSEAKISPSPA